MTAAKVRYNLQRSNTADLYYIRLVFRYDGQRLVWYPGERIKESDWSHTRQRVKRSPALPGAAAINDLLDRAESAVLTIFREHRASGKPLPPDRFRAKLDALFRGRTAEQERTDSVVAFIVRYASDRAASGAAATTVKTYGRLASLIRLFMPQLTFDRVDLDFLSEFTAWMSRRGLAPNTQAKMVSTIRTIMREAEDRALHSSGAYRSRRFTVRGEESVHIYLTDEELARIAALDLSTDQRLDRVRDLFLLGAWTGLRFSDLGKVRPESMSMVGNVQVLTIQAEKTRASVSVPILPEAASVLAKYGGSAPPVLSNQKMNKYVKEVAMLAGINDMIPVVRRVGALRTDTLSPKWMLVSSHTARRSFASNEYLRAVRAGRSIRPIMAILGHRREATFLKYVRIGDSEQAAIFAATRGNEKAAGHCARRPPQKTK